MRRLILTFAWAIAAAGCSVELPEPESAGARVLAARCGGCHRLYAPGAMTFEMWKVQLERMRRLFAQRGIPWMAAEEERVLLEYLGRHAGGVGHAAGAPAGDVSAPHACADRSPCRSAPPLRSPRA